MRNGREVVVITGASAGVGRATARRFAAQGARIGLLARGLDGLNAARIEVQALGGEALILPADVANPEEVNEAASLVTHTWGGIDIWINNAMASVLSPVTEMTPGDYSRVTQVTYLGTVHGTLAALEQMLPQDQRRHRAGRIGAGVPEHPAAVGLLRGETRACWVFRIRCEPS